MRDARGAGGQDGMLAAVVEMWLLGAAARLVVTENSTFWLPAVSLLRGGDPTGVLIFTRGMRCYPLASTEPISDAGFRSRCRAAPRRARWGLQRTAPPGPSVCARIRQGDGAVAVLRRLAARSQHDVATAGVAGGAMHHKRSHVWGTVGVARGALDGERRARARTRVVVSRLIFQYER